MVTPPKAMSPETDLVVRSCARAILWLALAQEAEEPTPDPNDNPTLCDICKGTGKSGDGLGPCPCGTRCRCADAESNLPPRERRVLFFYQDDCEACDEAKECLLPLFKGKSLSVGPGSHNHVQMLRYQDHPDIVASYKIKLLPTFVVIRKKKEQKRWTGTRSGADLDELIERLDKYLKHDD
jgi:hypothetical protein